MKALFKATLNLLEGGEVLDAYQIASHLNLPYLAIVPVLAVGVGSGKMGFYHKNGRKMYFSKRFYPSNHDDPKLNEAEKVVRRIIKGKPKPKRLPPGIWEKWKKVCEDCEVM